MQKEVINLSEMAKPLCHLLLATTTQISNELWLLLSYIGINVKICEVQDLDSNIGKNFNKRSNRFYEHTLVDSERLINLLKK